MRPFPQTQFISHFGGPGQRKGVLRNLLAKSIEKVPAGGEIFWVTYYFCDHTLAAALVRAHRRGVTVRVVMEGQPRTGRANAPVIQQLGGIAGIGSGLRVLTHGIPENILWQRSRLHEKLYYFSHPEPHVFIGSFNPSGTDDRTLLAKIGDQDYGYNMLVEIRDTTLVTGLLAHAYQIFYRYHGPWERFLPDANRILEKNDSRIYFFPRWRRAVLINLLSALAPGATVRIAASHISDRVFCLQLCLLADRGIILEILTHDTTRRAPLWIERKLKKKGVPFHRYVHPRGWPMHLKFILIEDGGRSELLFGSLNLSRRSLHLNHEILVSTCDSSLFEVFERKWQEIYNESCFFDERG